MPETAFPAALPHGSIALQRLVDDLMAYKNTPEQNAGSTTAVEHLNHE
jgi:hypothetical protein